MLSVSLRRTHLDERGLHLEILSPLKAPEINLLLLSLLNFQNIVPLPCSLKLHKALNTESYDQLLHFAPFFELSEHNRVMKLHRPNYLLDSAGDEIYDQSDIYCFIPSIMNIDLISPIEIESLYYVIDNQVPYQDAIKRRIRAAGRIYVDEHDVLSQYAFRLNLENFLSVLAAQKSDAVEVDFIFADSLFEVPYQPFPSSLTKDEIWLTHRALATPASSRTPLQQMIIDDIIHYFTAGDQYISNPGLCAMFPWFRGSLSSMANHRIFVENSEMNICLILLTKLLADLHHDQQLFFIKMITVTEAEYAKLKTVTGPVVLSLTVPPSSELINQLLQIPKVYLIIPESRYLGEVKHYLPDPSLLQVFKNLVQHPIFQSNIDTTPFKLLAGKLSMFQVRCINHKGTMAFENIVDDFLSQFSYTFPEQALLYELSNFIVFTPPQLEKIFQITPTIDFPPLYEKLKRLVQ